MNQFMHRLTLHDSRFKGFSSAAGGVLQHPARNHSLLHDSPPRHIRFSLLVVLVDCRRGTLPYRRIVRSMGWLSRKFWVLSS